MCEGRESLSPNFQTFQDPRHQFHGIGRLVSETFYLPTTIALRLQNCTCRLSIVRSQVVLNEDCVAGIAGHRHQSLSPVLEHSGTGQGSLIPVTNWYRRRYFCSFQYQTDRMPDSPAFRHLKKEIHKPYTSILAKDWNTPCTFSLLVVKGDTPCTSILLAVEGIHPARPYYWRWKGIHTACSYCWRWKWIHPASPFCWLWK